VMLDREDGLRVGHFVLALWACVMGVGGGCRPPMGRGRSPVVLEGRSSCLLAWLWQRSNCRRRGVSVLRLDLSLEGTGVLEDSLPCSLHLKLPRDPSAVVLCLMRGVG